MTKGVEAMEHVKRSGAREQLGDRADLRVRSSLPEALRRDLSAISTSPAIAPRRDATSLDDRAGESWLSGPAQRPPDSPALEAAVRSLAQMEWDYIQQVLGLHHGNVSAAARTLGIHRRSLQRKLRRRPPGTRG